MHTVVYTPQSTIEKKRKNKKKEKKEKKKREKDRKREKKREKERFGFSIAPPWNYNFHQTPKLGAMPLF
jgi:hypothetical protein